jgi:hypothetical protein
MIKSLWLRLQLVWALIIIHFSTERLLYKKEKEQKKLNKKLDYLDWDKED